MIVYNALNALAEKYGTPLYVYDADMIIQRYKELSDLIIWPKTRILYAMKANYNVAILKLLNDNGAWLDTVSPAEVILAQKIGYDKERILFTANNMTDEEMQEVHDTGVLFNIDSLSRLEKYGRRYRGDSVCLRFNSDVVAGENEKVRTGGSLTKFGILLENASKAKEIAEKHNLKIIGLHEHTGSGISDTDAIYKSMKNLLSIANHFPDLQFVDFGGGFKVPYRKNDIRIDYEKFGNKVTEIFSEFCKEYGRELYMYFEPGKYVVAESGTLLVKVNTIKNNKGRMIAGTDSGFPQLIRPMFYGAYHKIENLSNPDGEKQTYDIIGNICETGDRFAQDRTLPEIREGDILAIKNAGAYCYSMGGIYNLRSMPAEILLINSKTELVTERISNEDLADSIIRASF